MLDRQTDEQASLGLRHLLPALPHRPARIDRDRLAAGQEPQPGPPTVVPPKITNSPSRTSRTFSSSFFNQ
jgi:hypothetical protein